MPALLLRRLIGSVLRRTRLAQGRTLRDVAEVARVSVPYLSELERGRKEVSSEVLAAICRALGLHLRDLLDEVQRDLAVSAAVEEPVRPIVRRVPAAQRPTPVARPAPRCSLPAGRYRGQACATPRRAASLSSRRCQPRPATAPLAVGVLEWTLLESTLLERTWSTKP